MAFASVVVIADFLRFFGKALSHDEDGEFSSHHSKPRRGLPGICE